MKWLRKAIYLSLLVLSTSLVYGQNEYPERLPHHAVATIWSTTGNLYATSHANGDVKIYNNDLLLNNISNAHSSPIYGLAFSPDEGRIATGGEDGDLRIWNVITGSLIIEFLDLGNIVAAIGWSDDGNFIWASSFGSTDYIISADLITDTYVIDQVINVGPSEDISWKIDNTMVAIGGRGEDITVVEKTDYSARLLDATPDTDFFEPPNEFTTTVVWHPTANFIANGKINGWIHVWDLNSPSDHIPMLSLQANDGATDHAVLPFEYRVSDIEFSEDGSTLNSISSDGTLRIWDVETGRLLSDMNLGETILSAAFNPGASKLVYSTYSLIDVPPTLSEFIQTCEIYDITPCIAPTATPTPTQSIP